jgi:hypothetical protein
VRRREGRLGMGKGVGGRKEGMGEMATMWAWPVRSGVGGL